MTNEIDDSPQYWVGMPVTHHGETVGMVTRVEPDGDSVYLTMSVREGPVHGGVDRLSVYVEAPETRSD